MAAKTQQFDRRTIEEQTITLNGDGTDADVERIRVDHLPSLKQIDMQNIQIRRIWRPESRICHCQRAFIRFALNR